MRTVDEAPEWTDALHRVLRCVCESEGWQVGIIYLPDPEHPSTIVPVVSHLAHHGYRPFLRASQRHDWFFGEGAPGRVFVNGAASWATGIEAVRTALPRRRAHAARAGLVAMAALPVALGGTVSAVLELFSDRKHPRAPALDALMEHVCSQIAQILEREQMADLVWREQQSLLHTLHDSLGQSLAGLGMLGRSLSQRLGAAEAEAANIAQRIADEAQVALQNVRELAKDVFPVEVDAEGLLVALRQLGASAETLHQVRIRVTGDTVGSLRDGRLATQLYRIAQEAVANAVTHGKARTIDIALRVQPRETTLRVADDGIGLARKRTRPDGVGLRLMRYRATSVGALFSVDSGPNGGTLVTCTVRETPRPAAPEHA